MGSKHQLTTKARRRSTCRNSFHNIFAHHLKHAYGFQVLLENTPKTVGFQSFLQLCPQALECPTTNSQGSRFLCDIPQTSHISPVFWLTLSADSLCTVTFHVFPGIFLSFYLFSFSFEKIISFSALNIQVSGIKRYRNGLDHDQHHHCYGYYQRKKKKKTSILTIGVL